MPIAAARRGFKMVLFTASRGNTFVGGKCALPSALLVNCEVCINNKMLFLVCCCDMSLNVFTLCVILCL